MLDLILPVIVLACRVTWAALPARPSLKKY